MQGGRAPTAKQKRWHEWLRFQGCCNPICNQDDMCTSIHHAAGSTAKHNKVLIGQWWVLGFCYECHQGDEGIHKGAGNFDTDESRKEIEKRLFKKMVGLYEAEFNKLPCDDYVIAAISDYRR